MFTRYHRHGTCPKCGGEMGPPRYHDGTTRDCLADTREHLHYRCACCGYDETRPTKDARQPTPREDAGR